MKKKLISVLILALVFANFVLTAILMFTVLPETQKANTLIEKVCSAIDLEEQMEHPVFQLISRILIK